MCVSLRVSICICERAQLTPELHQSLSDCAAHSVVGVYESLLRLDRYIRPKCSDPKSNQRALPAELADGS